MSIEFSWKFYIRYHSSNPIERKINNTNQSIIPRKLYDTKSLKRLLYNNRQNSLTASKKQLKLVIPQHTLLLRLQLDQIFPLLFFITKTIINSRYTKLVILCSFHKTLNRNEFFESSIKLIDWIFWNNFLKLFAPMSISAFVFVFEQRFLHFHQTYWLVNSNPVKSLSLCILPTIFHISFHQYKSSSTLVSIFVNNNRYAIDKAVFTKLSSVSAANVQLIWLSYISNFLQNRTSCPSDTIANKINVTNFKRFK